MFKFSTILIITALYLSLGLRYGFHKASLIFLGVLLTPIVILLVTAFSEKLGAILLFIAMIAFVAALIYVVVWFFSD